MTISERELTLVQRMLSGDRLALARLITVVESRSPSVPEILKLINSKTGNAYVIGVTGPPGAGKSTLVNELILNLRGRDKKVGVLAVDPSSPFTGGAVLGDRIRMQDHALDRNVFIRSLGSRGSQGGLSRPTREIVKLYDAFGMDFIIIETVGVGQTELDVVGIADTVLVVLVPEAGDIIQTMKAGLMEIADVFVVNKADREGADKIAREIKFMTSLKQREDGWEIPVVLTSALEAKGTDQLALQIEAHRDFQRKDGILAHKREKRREGEFSKIMSEIIERRVWEKLRDCEVEKVLSSVKRGDLDPYEGAEIVISRII
ncbi:MAG: methylmalonyl Co-A mutase-associated GTPase MeaB [Deltaproteobacteria bacterium]